MTVRGRKLLVFLLALSGYVSGPAARLSNRGNPTIVTYVGQNRKRIVVAAPIQHVSQAVILVLARPDATDLAPDACLAHFRPGVDVAAHRASLRHNSSAGLRRAVRLSRRHSVERECHRVGASARGTDGHGTLTLDCTHDARFVETHRNRQRSCHGTPFAFGLPTHAAVSLPGEIR